MTEAGSTSTVPLLIAIDGLGAVGKSTVGQIVARRLGYRFVDTGEMYRALTWLALHRGIDTGDELSLSKLASEARVEIKTSASGEHHSVIIDGFDVATEIYSRKVETEVSNVSKVAGVRKSLLAHQRTMAEEGKLVMAGRDIGTVVLPRAISRSSSSPLRRKELNDATARNVGPRRWPTTRFWLSSRGGMPSTALGLCPQLYRLAMPRQSTLRA